MTGCAAQVKIPERLQGDSVQVPIKQERSFLSVDALRFEGYVVDQLDRSWTSGESSGAQTAREQEYSFQVRRPKGEPLEVYCTNRAQITEGDLGLGFKTEETRRALACHFASSAQGRFVLGSGGDGPGDRYLGRLELDGLPLTFRSVHEFEGTVFPSLSPLGYAIEREGDVLALLQTANDPVLTVASRQKDELWDGVAVITAILLFYQDIGDAPN